MFILQKDCFIFEIWLAQTKNIPLKFTLNDLIGLCFNFLFVEFEVRFVFHSHQSKEQFLTLAKS